MRHLLTARSTAGHGVHSPYIYDFLINTVRPKNAPVLVRGRNDSGIVRERNDSGTVRERNESGIARERNDAGIVRERNDSGIVRERNDAGMGSISGNAIIVSRVERLRQEMLSDQRTVRVTDLGAGPARGAGGERRVSEIAASASLPVRQVALLSRIAGSMRNNAVLKGEQNNNDIILELGTSLGISALALALAAPERPVVTVEGCPALAGIARENLIRHAAANAEVMNTEFSQALAFLRQRGTRVSLAFIDGNHRGRALIQYTETIREMGEEMIIVADDIHLNREMYRSWSSLTQSGIASASMETFRFGILFCLPNITPGHYKIRY